jgi:N-hydroxyarylamine O-acetyltransferase
MINVLFDREVRFHSIHIVVSSFLYKDIASFGDGVLVTGRDYDFAAFCGENLGHAEPYSLARRWDQCYFVLESEFQDDPSTEPRRLKLMIAERGLMDTEVYLERIGYRGPTRPSLNVLRRLHRSHLLSIPFENLDIHFHRPIILSEAAFDDKIIKHHRGGFCYELNGSFALLLKRLGFNVSMLSSRVERKGGRFGPDFDHMTLLVQLKEPWLADVGFGDSFTEPKELNISGPQTDREKDYHFTRKDRWILLSRRSRRNGRWEPQYKFRLTPRRLEDFVPRCLWQQTAPSSRFRKSRICTRLTPNGRLTLTDTKFIVTQGGKKVERPLKSPQEFMALLHRHFGIDLN